MQRGNRTKAFECYHFQWPWTTSGDVAKTKHRAVSLRQLSFSLSYANFWRFKYVGLSNRNSKKQYYSNLVSSSSDNRRRLWQTINKLLHRNSSSPLPTCTSANALADSLASFFTDNRNISLIFLNHHSGKFRHTTLRWQHQLAYVESDSAAQLAEKQISTSTTKFQIRFSTNSERHLQIFRLSRRISMS